MMPWEWDVTARLVALAVILVLLTSRYKPFVMRLRRNGQMISDPDGWTITLLNDNVWIARFGKGWRERYPTTWAVGYKRSHVWFYEPRGKHATHRED